MLECTLLFGHSICCLTKNGKTKMCGHPGDMIYRYDIQQKVTCPVGQLYKILRIKSFTCPGQVLTS